MLTSNIFLFEKKHNFSLKNTINFLRILIKKFKYKYFYYEKKIVLFMIFFYIFYNLHNKYIFKFFFLMNTLKTFVDKTSFYLC